MDIKDCKFCFRPGLSLLPLRLALVPEAANTLPGSLTQQARLPAGAYATAHLALRLITTGYVYQYDARAGGFWRCFAATPSGHFRECAVDEHPHEVPNFSCARTGHGAAAALINVQNAIEAGDVWVGYFRHWLTFDARRNLKNNAQLRDQYMVKINGRSLVTGGAVPADAGVRLAAGDQLTKLCPEYGSAADFTLSNRLYITNTTVPGQSRVGQADEVVKRMRDNSHNNAIVLALPDVIGMAQDANVWRNVKAGELAAWQADAKRARERSIGDLILNLEAGMTQQGQAKQWAERFAPKVNMTKVRNDKKQYDTKLKEFDTRIRKASDDWYLITNNSLFKRAWQHYDGMDKQDGKTVGAQMERDFAACTFGSGATQKEQQWWNAWLTAAPDDKEHPLWLAMAAGDKSVVAFLKGDAAKPFDMGKSDKLTDATKKIKESQEELHKWLAERRAKQALRQAQEASGLLAVTIGSQLQRLAATAAQQQVALVAGQRLRIVVSSRMEVTVTPHIQQMSVQRVITQKFEAMYGPPHAQLSVVTREAGMLRTAQSVEGAWLGSQFKSSKDALIDSWLPDPAAELGRVPNLAASKAPLALPTEALNPWRGMTQYMKTLKSVGGGLMGLSLALQLSNLSSSLVQLDSAGKGNATDKEGVSQEAWAGIVSGSLGIAGVGAEMFAGTIQARVTRSTVSVSASRLLTLAAITRVGGGLLGLLAATAEGIQLFGKAKGLYKDADEDAGSVYVLAGIFSAFAGVASAAATTVAAGAALSAVGATGTVATAIISVGSALSFIPVWGWIALSVGFVAVSLYLAITANTHEDTALEKWLSRCYYRNSSYNGSSRIQYADDQLALELRDFQQAIYAIQVALNWNDKLGKDEVELQVVMPGFDANVSDYAFKLELHGAKSIRTVVDRRTSPRSHDMELKPQPPQQHFMSAVKPGKKLIPMEDVVDIVQSIRLQHLGSMSVLSGKLRVNEDYYEKVTFKLEYWPDPIHHPELKLLPVPPHEALPLGSNVLEKAD